MLRLRQRTDGFTLVELLVAIIALILVVVFVTQLLSGATRITTAGHKRIDSDSQAQQVFDRIAADFNAMIKRTDVSYYFKTANAMTGNDQIAFFTGVPGHYPQSSYKSDTSLVAYRINANTASSSNINYNRLERLAKGLLLNAAVSPSPTPPSTPAPLPLLFVDSNYSTAINNRWPAATHNDNTAQSADSDYGLIGSQVFRFEYYYLLNPSGPSEPPGLSAGPWADTDSSFRIKNIAAIVVAIGVIDARSRNILSRPQMEILAGANGQTSPFADFQTGWSAGQLLSTWQGAVVTDSQIGAMPHEATQNIRFYERYFPLTQ